VKFYLQDFSKKTAMKKRIYILFVLSVLLCNTSFSQKTKVLSALKEYENLSYSESIPKLLKLVAKEKNSIKVIERLSNAYYFTRQMAEASNWYKKLLELYPKTKPENYFRYAQSLKGQEKYDEANTILKKFATLNPEDSRAKELLKSQNYFDLFNDKSKIFQLINLDINTEFSDFGPSTYKSNLIFSSSRDLEENIYSRNAQPFLDLFELNNEGGIIEIQGDINTKYHESSTAFTKDGKTVYFTRNNYFKGKFKKNSKETHVLKIYKAVLIDSVWINIKPLPFNNDEYSVAHPALSQDDKKLYFASDMLGTNGASDIFVVNINADGSYGQPTNLGPKINTEGRENFPFISEKGILYFSSDGHLGLGGLDVFSINIDEINNSDTKIENLGKPINSSKDDFGFIINETTGRGYMSSNREGGKGDDDIYSFEIPNCLQIVTGTIKDKNNLELLPGAIVTLYNAEDKMLKSITVGENATYEFQDLNCENEFTIKIDKKDYSSTEKSFITPHKPQKLIEHFLLEKTAAEIGTDLFKLLNLEPVYFDYDKSDIPPDAEIELAKIINYLKQFPRVKLDVRSHTDSRGKDAYNLTLSNRRNQSTRDYIINNGGISQDRVTGSGYGETQLTNNCSNDDNCTEEEHKTNRRSEFIVIEN
jgi:outer membrane protein OmpA-like peptidoglycan-associated protein/tetratricopeptide (TPR) repeat protein